MLAVISPGVITRILLAAAGMLLPAGVDDGVCVLVATVFAATPGVTSAWLFCIRITA